MIQTKEIIIYGDRDDRSGRIMIEVFPLGTTKEGTEYLVNDWDITNPDNPIIYKSKKVFYNNDKINMLDAYIMATYSDDFIGLSKTDSEWKKIQIALMIDTQTNLFPNGNTIYRLQPSDWEFTSI